MVLHNPNNWHWVNKDCRRWSTSYLEKALTVSANDTTTSAQVTRLRTLDGDVEVCQRKGRVISLFDLSLVLEFTGKSDDVEVDGTIRVPEVAYDTERDDFVFEITINNETGEKLPVKTLVRNNIVPQLRDKLSSFGNDLIEAHAKDIQHPDTSQTQKTSLPSEPQSSSSGGSECTSGTAGTPAYNTTKVTLNPVFTASAEQLYEAFVDPSRIAAWTRAKPDFKPEVGAEYSLFNGNITGKVLGLEPGKRLKLSWRLRDWKQGHLATQSLEFCQASSDTTLAVEFVGVPIGQEELVEQNFNEYYVRPIMLTFGYGLP